MAGSDTIIVGKKIYKLLIKLAEKMIFSVRKLGSGAALEVNEVYV